MISKAPTLPFLLCALGVIICKTDDYDLLLLITGAELSLPLAPTRPQGCDEEECSDAEDDHSAASWLTTMGLPAHDFPTLHPNRLALYPTLSNRKMYMYMYAFSGTNTILHTRCVRLKVQMAWYQATLYCDP